MEKPVIIRNGNWLNPDGVFSQGTLLVENRRLRLLSQEESPPAASGDLDLHGFFIIPGMIDAHVHFREPWTSPFKEGIRNGCMAAIRGGVTTVLDMPNTIPPCDDLAQLEAKMERYRRKSLVNWGLHFLASDSNPSVLPRRIASTKIFMAKSSLRPATTDEDTLRDIFSRSERVAIHAEDETCFIGSGALLHHEARPVEAVASALGKIERAYNSLPSERRPRLVLCHASTELEVNWVKIKKQEGWDIWMETCPHYLFFTSQDFVEKGNWFKVNPPLRSEADRLAILGAVKDGTLDFISTDHAPHRAEEKANPISAPSGIASIEWLGPLLLSMVDQGTINWKRFLELSVVNSARCYGIVGRDGVKDGNFADLTVISAKAEYEPRSTIQSMTGFNPYSDFRFSRRIEMVMVSGQWGYSNGEGLLKDISGMEVYGNL